MAHYVIEYGIIKYDNMLLLVNVYNY